MQRDMQNYSSTHYTYTNHVTINLLHIRILLRNRNTCVFREFVQLSLQFSHTQSATKKSTSKNAFCIFRQKAKENPAVYLRALRTTATADVLLQDLLQQSRARAVLEQARSLDAACTDRCQSPKARQSFAKHRQIQPPVGK